MSDPQYIPGPKKRQIFNGQIYRMLKLGYFQCGQVFLHRAVWEHANGPLPAGLIIHHIDHNPRNNALSNLQAMTPSEHSRYHRLHEVENNDAYVRRGAARRAHPMVKDIEALCSVCGKAYMKAATKSASVFCGISCAAKLRYIKRVRDVQRECPICGKVFFTYPLDKAETCGYLCGAQLKKRRAEPG